MADLTVGELVAYASVDNKSFDSGLSHIERGLKAVTGSAAASTGRMEKAVASGFDRMLHDVQSTLGDVAREAGRSGQASGTAFSRSLDAALDGVDQVAGRAGRDAGTSFIDEAREALSYGELDAEIDLDIAAALAAAETVDRALEDLDDRRVRVDVDTDSAMSMIGDLTEAAGGLGGKLNDAISVIGGSGPGQVAILSGALMALPTVAGLAAAGIVTAVGGALATVGIKAAANADVVRHAWSELGSDLKAELGDVAEPLEGSLVRAADVAEQAFQRLKPSLARVFEDLVPDLDNFIAKVGDGVGSLGPTLEKLGDSFGTVLSELGDRMPTIIDNVGDSLEIVAQILDDDPTLLADALEDATALMKMGGEVLAWADDISAALTLPFNAEGASNKLWEAMFGASPEEIMEQKDQFSTIIGGIQEDLAAGAKAVAEAGSAGDEAAGGVRNFKDSLTELFEPARAALDAEIRLKEALEDAAQAARDTKISEVDRLRSVKDLTTAIADAATAENDRTGKTDAAGKAFADQLPQLVQWAGKNDAARDAVAGLGNSLGVTIKRTDDGTIAVDKFGKAVITLPNGKEVKIDADTAAALAALATTQKGIDGLKDKTVTIFVKTEHQSDLSRQALRDANANAAGDIERYASGGVRAFAAGGRTSPGPHVATGPTILYGEGSDDEAFIPYASQHRSRAIDLLSEVASDFGLEVYGKAAAERVSSVAQAVGGASTQLSSGLDSAMTVMRDTLGDTGSLTSAIGDVGKVGESLVDGWTAGSAEIGATVGDMGATVSDAVIMMADETTASTHDLMVAVEELGAVVAATAKLTMASKGAPGMIAGHGPELTMAPLPKPKGLVEGHYGRDGAEGFVSRGGMGLTRNGGGGSGGVTVNIENATVREDADIPKIGSTIGFNVLAQGMA
ncbi:hypothetical protein ITP53_16500 [Nonomuraea sp. K274]|uniref:Uncharacterized protein n=1 Tax=Nonomuraea cypriaca TaxID=1187855 RepID=A0A931A8T7_9ACTN|nr:hypothetical protein [Nonomuraea cypriaca]MBF8187303.1 hypothetical protein [Nonomuraea cypriaca]